MKTADASHRRPAHLTRREFARALRLGLGRARIDVRRHGLAGREDLLVAACLRNGTLWPCLEGSLAKWLLAIAKDGGALPAVRRAVLDATVRPIANAKDLRQVADLVGRLAGTGDRSARKALLRLVDVQRPEAWAGAQQAIQWLGEAGWVHVARSFGRRWPAARMADLGWLAQLAADEIGARRACAVLRRAAVRDRHVRPFLDAIERNLDRERRTPRESSESEAVADLESLERLVAARARSVHLPWRWARNAPAADRAEAWRRIFTERDVRKLRRRMTTFDHRGRPRVLDARLFRLADHPDRRVRYVAARLTSNYRGESVRAFALRRLRRDPVRAIDDGVLAMLRRNARADDVDVLDAALPPRPSRETAHKWVRGVKDVAARHRGPRWDALLLRAYDVNPCRDCREFLLDDLVERGAASPALLREALWDANGFVRRVARAALRRAGATRPSA